MLFYYSSQESGKQFNCIMIAQFFKNIFDSLLWGSFSGGYLIFFYLEQFHFPDGGQCIISPHLDKDLHARTFPTFCSFLNGNLPADSASHTLSEER